MFTSQVLVERANSSQLVNGYDIVLSLPWPFKVCSGLSVCFADTYWLTVSRPADPKQILPDGQSGPSARGKSCRPGT